MPLAHVFAHFIQVLCVPSGATMGYTPDPKQLLPDLASFRPTFILAVPRVFEKVYNSAEQKAAASGAPAALPVGRTGVYRVLARGRDQRRPVPRAARPARTRRPPRVRPGCAPRSAVARSSSGSFFFSFFAMVRPVHQLGFACWTSFFTSRPATRLWVT